MSLPNRLWGRWHLDSSSPLLLQLRYEKINLAYKSRPRQMAKHSSTMKAYISKMRILKINKNWNWKRKNCSCQDAGCQWDIRTRYIWLLWWLGTSSIKKSYLWGDLCYVSRKNIATHPEDGMPLPSQNLPHPPCQLPMWGDLPLTRDGTWRRNYKPHLRGSWGWGWIQWGQHRLEELHSLIHFPQFIQ